MATTTIKAKDLGNGIIIKSREEKLFLEALAEDFICTEDETHIGQGYSEDKKRDNAFPFFLTCQTYSDWLEEEMKDSLRAEFWRYIANYDHRKIAFPQVEDKAEYSAPWVWFNRDEISKIGHIWSDVPAVWFNEMKDNQQIKHKEATQNYIVFNTFIESMQALERAFVSCTLKNYKFPKEIKDPEKESFLQRQKDKHEAFHNWLNEKLDEEIWEEIYKERRELEERLKENK